MNRIPIVAALAVAAILVAGAAVGVALTQKPAIAATSAPYARLEGEIRQLHQQLESDAPIFAEVGKLKGIVDKISICLPELREEIDGLTPEVSAGNVFLQQHAQVSSYCSSTLNGGR